LRRVYLYLLVLIVVIIYPNMAFGSKYKDVSNKIVNWRNFIIKPHKGWYASYDSSSYQLVFRYSKNEYGIVMLSDMDEKLTKSQYKRFVKLVYKKIKKGKDISSIYLKSRTKYTVLGMKHTPAVISITKNKKFFTFLPYVRGHVYTVVAISWRKDRNYLPGYIVDMLNRIYIKLDTAGIDGIVDIKEPAKSKPAQKIENRADRYRYGIGVAPNQYRAFILYKKLAKKGDADALVELAEYYNQGIFVPQDKYKAKRLLKKAAQKGSLMAKWQLEFMNEN
jgi:hypothetical protein